MSNSDWDDELDILSAENVSFAIESAGIGSRFGAALIDLTIQGVVITLLLIGAAWVSGYVLPLVADFSAWGRALGAAFLILIGVTITHGYYFLFEWLWDGQTPGKRWLGLRVVQTNGMPITAWESLTRNILRTVDFLPMMYGIGAIVAFINPLNRRVGDMVAGTMVARERHDPKNTVLDIDTAADAFLAAHSTDATYPANAAPAARAVPAPVAINEYSLIANEPIIATTTKNPSRDPREAALLMRLNAQDIELLNQFLSRRTQLQKAARERLAHSVATRLAMRFEQPLPPAPQIESFLENVARALHESA